MKLAKTMQTLGNSSRDVP